MLIPLWFEGNQFSNELTNEKKKPFHTSDVKGTNKRPRRFSAIVAKYAMTDINESESEEESDDDSNYKSFDSDSDSDCDKSVTR